MKKLLVFALCALMLVSVCACGGESGPVNQNIPDSPSEDTFTPDNSEENIQDEHTHVYSNANCTSAAKCSCGATQGSALGHKYSEATCTAAAKCSRCGETKGNALGHKYSSGKCTVCGTSDPNALPSVAKNEIIANFDQAIADLESSFESYTESTKGGFLASEYRSMAVTLAKRAASYTGIAHTYASSYPKATLSDGHYIVDGLSTVKQTIDLLATDPSTEAYNTVLNFAKEIRSKIK